MERSEIETKVIEVVCEHLHVDREKVKLETDFVNDLNADSLDLAELSMEVEDTFDIHHEQSDGEAPAQDAIPQTVGDVVNVVVKALAEKGK